VTRLGEFSPIVFFWAVFLITKGAHILDYFFTRKKTVQTIWQ
jgi:hypothetical protein